MNTEVKSSGERAKRVSFAETIASPSEEQLEPESFYDETESVYIPEEPGMTLPQEQSLPSPPCDIDNTDPLSAKAPLTHVDTLPNESLPMWLSPLHIGIDDPSKVPLCWYAVPFYRENILDFTRHAGLIEMRDNDDMDSEQTWRNFVDWFSARTGLVMKVEYLWNKNKLMLTFLSNRELHNVCRDVRNDVFHLLDELDYPSLCKPMWYLDRSEDLTRFNAVCQAVAILGQYQVSA